MFKRRRIEQERKARLLVWIMVSRIIAEITIIIGFSIMLYFLLRKYF